MPRGRAHGRSSAFRSFALGWLAIFSAIVWGAACGRAESGDPPRTIAVSDVGTVEPAPQVPMGNVASAEPPPEVSIEPLLDAALGGNRCPAAGRVRAGEFCPAKQSWARDPDTGACCRYENECVGPDGWAVFGSAEECASSCRCASFEFPEGINPRITWSLQYRIEHTSLECACPNGECRNQLDHLERIDAEAALLCDSLLQYQVRRLRGCEMIAFEAHVPGYPGSLSVFDEASGALIGMRFGSDTNSLPCGTFDWVAGRDFRCDDVQTCAICGTGFDPPLPPCD